MSITSWFIKAADIVRMGVADFRILLSTCILLGFVLMSITLVLLRQIGLFVPLVFLMPKIGRLGINNVFLAPALTDLIIAATAVFMLAAEFYSLAKQNTPAK